MKRRYRKTPVPHSTFYRLAIENPTMKAQEIADTLDVDYTVALAVMRDLVSSGQLELYKNGRAYSYCLPGRMPIRATDETTPLSRVMVRKPWNLALDVTGAA